MKKTLIVKVFCECRYGDLQFTNNFTTDYVYANFFVSIICQLICSSKPLLYLTMNPKAKDFLFYKKYMTKKSSNSSNPSHCVPDFNCEF